jgi:hypothetical protein
LESRRIDRVIRQMTEQGKGDREIGEAVGLCRFAVVQRRKGMKIMGAKAARAAKRREMLVALHAQGLTDKEAALCLDMTPNAAGELRRRLGLALNRPLVPPGKRPQDAGRSALPMWRRRNGIPKPQKPAKSRKAKHPTAPAAPDMRTKVRPICAALGNVYAKEPRFEVQEALAVAMRAVHTSPEFARAWSQEVARV